MLVISFLTTLWKPIFCMPRKLFTKVSHFVNTGFKDFFVCVLLNIKSSSSIFVEEIDFYLLQFLKSQPLPLHALNVEMTLTACTKLVCYSTLTQTTRSVLIHSCFPRLVFYIFRESHSAVIKVGLPQMKLQFHTVVDQMTQVILRNYGLMNSLVCISC